MHINSITFKEHYVPKYSYGACYSETDVFEVNFTVDGETFTRNLSVEIWYCCADTIPECFVSSLNSLGLIDEIENIKEAFCMYAWELCLFSAYGFTYEQLLQGFEKYQK